MRMDDAVAVALELGARAARGGSAWRRPRDARRIAGVGREPALSGATRQAVQRASMHLAHQRVGRGAHARAGPGASISTKRISPASAFLSTRISSR